MKKVYTIITLIILIIISVAVFKMKNESPTIENLQAQLNGGKCKFEISENKAVERGWFGGMSRRSDAEKCIIDAAKLVALMYDKNIDTVPILIDALRNNYNVDSGDGIIPVRSEIALALGRLGDRRALAPLQEILASEDPVTLSKTGGFPSGYQIQKGTSHEAVKIAIAEINGK